MLHPQPRPSQYYYPINTSQTQQQQQQQQQQLHQHQLSSQTQTSHRPRSDLSAAFNFESDQPLFDFQAEQYSQSHSQSPMAYGQLTPTSTTRAHHHRESSLSTLGSGSAGPSSPYTANTSNPQVAGDLHNEWYDLHASTSKPLTPIHTPSQEQFLYNQFYQNTNTPFGMSQDGPKIKSELMPAPEFQHPGRRIAVATSRESPSTPPSYEDERQKNGEIPTADFETDNCLHSLDQAYRNSMPKLERTMTDVYSDELYNPNFQFTSSSQPSIPAPIVPHNDIFAQRLQAANNQHLSVSNTQIPLTIPSRDRSPFRQGSPLAPVGNSFASQSQGMRFNSATHMREQQKAEADARALQQQIERSSPSGVAPNTISPKDVDLVYHESEEDRNVPLFPPQQQQQRQMQSPTYQQSNMMTREQLDADDTTSQHSYGSMATSRRPSSSAYSTASQGLQQQSSFNFTPPSVPGGIRVPQQYPFVPASRRQASNLSNNTEDFPATLVSMESSSSEYAAEASDNPKPTGASADTGTYTCTYHGCTLRFDTPAKLQRHKREGHRSSASVIGGGEENGMTSQAQRNSQAGPHKCERINPSTGKPCNTIFSRPYDLTRHEDTIHNARKQKVHCPICTEEKTFSRNDALTRHMRVVHPQFADQQNRRRRGGS